MNTSKKYVFIAAILLAVIILFILIFRTTEEIEDIGEVGELVGELTIECLGIENIKVRNGVNKATLQEAIGLYPFQNEDLQAYNGNICMFSYSTGEKESYFKNLNNIRSGDLICYKTNNVESNYSVYGIDLLPESDISYLNTTKDNIITLITKIPSTTINLVVRGYKIER